jgi:hypothetical protein
MKAATLQISQMAEFHYSFPLCRNGMLSSRNTVLTCSNDSRQIVKTGQGSTNNFVSKQMVVIGGVSPAARYTKYLEAKGKH